MIVRTETGPRMRVMDPKMAGMIDVMMQKIRDSGEVNGASPNKRIKDSVKFFNKSFSGRRERLIQFLFDVDSLQDSIHISELQTAYGKRLDKENLDIPFAINRVTTRETHEPVYNEVTLGFQSPVTYRLTLGNTGGFLLKPY
jgi:two-component system phosphate regulon sensor histidine kinase PhoR